MWTPLEPAQTRDAGRSPSLAVGRDCHSQLIADSDPELCPWLWGTYLSRESKGHLLPWTLVLLLLQSARRDAAETAFRGSPHPSWPPPCLRCFLASFPFPGVGGDTLSMNPYRNSPRRLCCHGAALTPVSDLFHTINMWHEGVEAPGSPNTKGTVQRTTGDPCPTRVLSCPCRGWGGDTK